MVSGSQYWTGIGCQGLAEIPNDPIIVTNLRRIRSSPNKNKLKVFSFKRRRRISLWKSLAEGRNFSKLDKVCI